MMNAAKSAFLAVAFVAVTVQGLPSRRAAADSFLFVGKKQCNLDRTTSLGFVSGMKKASNCKAYCNDNCGSFESVICNTLCMRVTKPPIPSPPLALAGFSFDGRKPVSRLQTWFFFCVLFFFSVHQNEPSVVVCVVERVSR